MSLFLFGLNEVALEILENPDWSPIDNVSVIIEREFQNQSKLKCPVPLSFWDELQPNTANIFINCIGYRSLVARSNISDLIRSKGTLRNYISPDTRLSRSAKIGDGVVILGNTIVERGATIGEGSLVWGGAHLCHDCSIGRFNFIAAGVRIGGWAKTGDFCKFGFNSVLEQKSIVPNFYSSGALKFSKSILKNSPQIE